MFVLFLLILDVLHFALEAKGSQCEMDEYQCFNGQCIPLQQFCDYNIHCEDGSDEIDCYGECIVRHDVYGTLYKGKRQISRGGRQCSAACRGREGVGIECNTTDGTSAYCFVPPCENQRINSGNCDFSSDFCGWQVKSNSSLNVWVSEENIGHIDVAVSNRSMIVLSSPIMLVDQWFRYDWIKFEYTVIKEKNVYWTTSPWIPNDIFHYPMLKFDDNRKMTKFECERCSNAIQWRFPYDEHQTKVYLYFFIHCTNGCNVTLMIHNIKKVDEMTGNLEPMEHCKFDEYPCSYSSINCIPIESILDRYEDCGQDTNHGFETKMSCKANQIPCNYSKSCIPITSSEALNSQCLSNRTELPYQKSSSKCPGVYECKRRVSDKNLNCLNSHELCDGVPNCPHWDDEIECMETCPPGCYSCDDKKYKCSPASIDYITNRVSYLDLSGHSLNITDLCSLSILTLTHLNISRCGLSDISCLFNRKPFPSLRVLDVSYNYITEIERNFFPYKKIGSVLYLDGNPLKVIRTFKNWNVISLRNSSLRNLRWNRGSDFYLNLHINVKGPIETLMDSPYKSDFYASKLYLSDNKIDSFWFLIFCAIAIEFDLSNNNFSTLTKLPYNPFLRFLFLSNNKIKIINSTHLENIQALEVLNLGWNKIEKIGDHSFYPVRKTLKKLSLHNNAISSLSSNVFRNLSRMTILELQGNTLTYLDHTIFKDLVDLRKLALQNNRLSSLPKGLFRTLNVLEELNIAGNSILVYDNIFAGLGILNVLKVRSFTLCCARPSSVHMEFCIAEFKFISSCSYLLESGFFSVSIWYITILILIFNVSNGFIIMKRSKHTITTSEMFRLQYLVSDILMGLYLMILGYNDVFYKGSFGYNYNEWVHSTLCILAEFLLTISIQSSIFLTLAIPFYAGLQSSVRCCFHKRYIISIVVWILSFSCALPSMSTRYFYFNDNYTEISKCFALPITKDFVNSKGSGYSNILFLGLNPVIYVTIILKEVTSAVTRTRSKNYTRFVKIRQKKLNAIFFNSCTRCTLLCVFGYLALSGINVASNIWLFIFLVPINSILNCVYTIKELVWH